MYRKTKAYIKRKLKENTLYMSSIKKIGKVLFNISSGYILKMLTVLLTSEFKYYLWTPAFDIVINCELLSVAFSSH